jgi:hypothetical protein
VMNCRRFILSPRRRSDCAAQDGFGAGRCLSIHQLADRVQNLGPLWRGGFLQGA